MELSQSQNLKETASPGHLPEPSKVSSLSTMSLETYKLMVEMCMEDTFAVDNIAEAISNFLQEKQQTVIRTMIGKLEEMCQGDSQESAVFNPYIMLAKAQLQLLTDGGFDSEPVKDTPWKKGSEHSTGSNTATTLPAVPSTSYVPEKDAFPHISSALIRETISTTPSESDGVSEAEYAKNTKKEQGSENSTSRDTATTMPLPAVPVISYAPGKLHQNASSALTQEPISATLSESEVHIVPRIEATVNGIVLVLSLVIHEELKLRFCEVLRDLIIHIQDIVTDCDKKKEVCFIRRDSIATKMNEAFREIYYTWFPNAGTKLKQAILQVISVICFLLHKSDLNGHFPRLIQGLWEEYTTSIEHVYITKTLSQILQAINIAEIQTQEPWFQAFCPMLFSQVFIKIDESKPLVAENSDAAVHCFTLLANSYHYPILDFLCEKVNAVDHIGCLTAVRILQELRIPDTSTILPLTTLSRLLTVASAPYLQTEDLRSTALSLLKTVSALIHPSLESLWEEKVPKLLSDLEVEKEEPFQQQKWEKRLIMFINSTVKAIGDESWNIDMIQEIRRQLTRYSGYPKEQLFLYKFYGAVLQASNNGTLVKDQLNILLQATEHQEESQRKAIAAGVGIAAREHLEDTLEVLEKFGSAAITRGSSGIVNIIKSLVDGSWKKTVNLVMICLGNVATYAQEILPLAETIISRILFYYHCSPTDDAWKLSFMKSIIMVSSAISNSSRTEDFVLGQKIELMNIVVGFIEEAPVSKKLKTPVCKKAMSCIRHLSKLNPEITPDLKTNLITMCMKIIFSLSIENESSAEASGTQSLNLKSISTFQDMLKGFLEVKPTLEELLDILQNIDYWITATATESRENALMTCTMLLKYSVEQFTFDTSEFHSLAHLIGLIAPRCSEKVIKIQHSATEFCCYALQIQLCLKGISKDQAKEMVAHIHDRENEDTSYSKEIIFTTALRIAQISGEHLCLDQFVALILTLLDGLADFDIACSRTAALMLHNITQEHSDRLEKMVPDLLNTIYSRLNIIKDFRLRQEVLQIVRTVLSKHPKDAMTCLLKYPLPFDSIVSEMWSVLSIEAIVNRQVLLLLYEKLMETSSLESKASLVSTDSSPEDVPPTEKHTAVNALYVMFSVPETRQLIEELFPPLLHCLLLYISSSDGQSQPEDEIVSLNKDTTGTSNEPFNSKRFAVKSLKILLLHAGFGPVIEEMETTDSWEQLQSIMSYRAGLSQLVRFMIKTKGHQIPAVLIYLYPFFTCQEKQTRVFATSFYVEVLSNPSVSEDLPLRSLIEILFEGLTHTCADIRILCLRGIGNMALHLPKKAEKLKILKGQLPSVLQSFYDAEPDVICEAMATTSKVLRWNSKKEMGKMCLEIAMHIRPYFEDESEKLQRSSLALLGDLMQLVPGRYRESMREQIKNSLLVLVLQMNNPNLEIAGACKYAVAQCSSIMNWSSTWTRGGIMKQIQDLV